ncbi:MAG TPA: 3-oxoacid CoA-transferase subunit A, partial [Anaerovoracaceae bacterium]|nr:3-oxoacid CoA-transferase subunit A [Anaerovoracaceae bacterium]
TNGQIKTLIASHVGLNPEVAQRMNTDVPEDKLECILVPQGTLAEKIRAAGAGLGGVLTPTGVGTIVAEGKETLTIEGKEYLLELPLHADFALCRADYCDTFGNFAMLKATKNFNHVMAMAADTVLLASEQVFEIGEKDPDFYQVAGVYIDYIVKGEQPWQI